MTSELFKMQSGVPSLPVVCSDKHSCSSSKYSDSINGTPRKSKSLYGSASHLLRRKPFHDVYANSPYRSSARFHPLSQSSRSNKNPVDQRVLSAKMLRVKQLQNQLTDAHYHLNELSNENKLLKAIQKKQESALRKYEGANAELPRIINSHHEELRILQIKYKKLKEQHKNTCDTLKEKEKELNSLQVFNKKLLQLSQDRNLLEREKLQSQLTDLNYQFQQQQDTIQKLNKKLALETKSLKQQNQMEIAKHKETQKQLQDTLDKLKSLEDLLDNREKRMYYNNQLPAFNKNKSSGNYSCMSLEDSGFSFNYSKLNTKKSEFEINDKILPNLSDMDMNVDRKSSNTHLTFTSSEHKFRFQKPKSKFISEKLLDRVDKLPSHTVLKKEKEEDSFTIDSDELSDNEQKMDINNKDDDENSKKNVTDEFDFSHISDLKEEINAINEEEALQHENLFKKSREVYARLTSDQSSVESDKPTSFEEIEAMVKNEFKIGHDLASTAYNPDFCKSHESHNNEEIDFRSQDIMLSPSKLKIENLHLSEDIQMDENKDSDDFQNPLEKTEELILNLNIENSPRGHGDKTFRYPKNDSIVENSFEQINQLKDEDEKTDEYGGLKILQPEDCREKLNIYLEKEDTSKVKSNDNENIVKVSKEEGKGKNNIQKHEKKEGKEKLPKKGFDKAKLLAEMKAIDNNDNIEYFDQKLRRNSGSIKSQITENLYRGIPTQRRSETLVNGLTNTKFETKTKSNGYNKIL